MSTTFNDLLGPDHQRYFGSGYRRVRHGIDKLDYSSHAINDVTTRGFVTYPEDWSMGRAGLPRTPHLSAIDSILLAVRTIDTHMSSVMSNTDVSRSWIRSVDFAAGKQPTSIDQAIPIQSTWILGSREPLTSSVFRTQTGLATVDTTIEHPPVDHDRFTREPSLIAPNNRCDVYQHGYRASDHYTTIADISLTTKHIRCDHRTLAEIIDTPSGLEAHYWPHVTIIDSIILFSQMAQCITYELDHTSRGAAHTLWMRKLHVSQQEPRREPLSSFSSTLRVEKAQTFTRNGKCWHRSDVQVQSTLGTESTASIAYYTDPER